MTVAVQRMFGILERWNNNQVTPSLSKPHELSYRSNKYTLIKLIKFTDDAERSGRPNLAVVPKNNKNPPNGFVRS